MTNYMEVGEVCKLTGLTRKHLYYFHKENVVRASAYKGYSVNGNDPYKLYDDMAVAKLQQIAMYYELGWKRDKIRDVMMASDYDSNQALDDLLVELQQKRSRIDKHIEAIEQLKLMGTKNGVLSLFKGISLEQLGGYATSLIDTPLGNELLSFLEESMDEISSLKFEETFILLLDEISMLEETEYIPSDRTAIFKKLFDMGISFLGAFGYLFVAMMFMSVLGGGTMLPEISNKIAEKISVTHAQAATSYIKEDFDSFLTELVKVIVDHHDIIGTPFNEPKVTTLVNAVKAICKSHYGITEKLEYRLLFHYFEADQEYDQTDPIKYTLGAVKYYCI